MGLLLFNSNGKSVFSSDNAGSFIIAPDTIKVVPGGTATGVTITRPYNGSEIATMKSELSSTCTADELNSAVAVSIQGTKAGTVVLDVSTCGAVGDYILIVHRKSDGTWEQLYKGAIPNNSQVTVTLSSFSPIMTMKTEAPPNP